jgi:hypothetical protein
MRLRIAVLVLPVLLLAALFGCGKHPSQPGMGQVTLRLTDDPVALEAVNLVVDQVSIHRAGDEGEREGGEDSLEVDDGGEHGDSLDVNDDEEGGHSGGWEVLSQEQHTFDLLTLRNGVVTTLASGTVPAGHYTQVRLKLGPGSNVVVNGQSHPLVVPSGMQSGLKLVGQFEVNSGETKELTLDFNAAKSVVLATDGSYRLSPTIKLVR